MPAETAARLAVMFGRQSNSTARTVDEIASDAIKLAALGRKIRRKLERQKPLNGELTEALAIAERYQATLIDNRDLNGCVVALKFRSGLYSSGFRNWFFVA